MSGVKEVGEEKSNELEEVSNEGVKAEDEEGASGEIVDNHVGTRVNSDGSVNGSLPVWRDRIGLSFCIRLYETSDCQY